MPIIGAQDVILAMSTATPQSGSGSKAKEPPVAPSRRRFFHSRKTKSDPSNVGLQDSNETPNTAVSHSAPPPPESSSLQGSQILPMRQGEFQSHHADGDFQPGPSVPSESPLRRPTELEEIPAAVEGPLQRPSDDKEDMAFSDIIAAFAVDVSGSTEGRVLEEEKDVIRSLCSGLSRDARTQAQIIPWNHVTKNVLRLSELNNLYSSGGTDPNSINTNTEATIALKKCSAWFLLTDGEMNFSHVHKFSDGICKASLHGTPCVIVLFGYKSARPWKCNVSVGLSVFSNAADCLFLFHDIDTTQVYILQSKGNFNAVLPPRYHETVLHSETLWQDLPTFGYRQLFDLPIPLRQQLRPDDLLLQDGKRVNLHDLYRHRVDPAIAHDIMENDDNLKTVLLSAQLRGEDDEIEAWISKQTLTKPSNLMADRPDTNNQATRSIQKLLNAMFSEPPDYSTIHSLQQHIRVAHFANWEVFLSNLGARNELESVRSTVVSDAMTRVRSNRNDIRSGTHSPGLLAPVSPSPSVDPLSFVGAGYMTPPNSQTRHPKMYGSWSTAEARHSWGLKAPSRPTNLSELERMRAKLGEDAGILFIKGYRYEEEFSDPGFKDTCLVCGQDNVLLTVLLKLPPKGLSTPGFPSPGDRKGLAYPLAMGSYPETDVLSSYVCCDSCAQALIRGKLQLDDGEITAAIPLMPAAFVGKYKETTLELIDAALGKRFHRTAVLLVFLSIIYSTLAIIDGDKVELRREALKKLSMWMCRNAKLPLDLSISTTGNTPRTGTFAEPLPLVHVIVRNLCTFHEPDSPLLQHPVGGFIVLMLLAHDLDFDLQELHETIWQRFLFHLVEKYCALMATNQARAVAELQDIIQVNSTDPSKTGQNLGNPDCSSANVTTTAVPEARKITPDDLCGTHLLSEEELDDFKRLGALFEPIETRSSALMVFLTRLYLDVPKVTGNRCI